MHWWKLVAALFLSISIGIGLNTPLAPGIENYSPTVATEGDTIQLLIAVVNAGLKTHSQNLSCYLISDSTNVKAVELNPKDNENLTTNFIVPRGIIGSSSKHRLFDLLVNSDYDGNIILKNAVDISSDSLIEGNKYSSRPIQINHEVPSYFSFPMREILYESIRNLFYHVPMWFAMTILLCVAMFFSFKFLRSNNLHDDLKAAAFTQVALMFGFAGIITGMQWAKVTWGAWWNNDPKESAAAIGLLIYSAYFVLRSAIDDPEKRARISSVFNVFALGIFIPIIYIVPRLTESLHPGNGGNPGFNSYDLDGNLRLIFYPSIIGWTLLGVWMAQLHFRIARINPHLLSDNN